MALICRPLISFVLILTLLPVSLNAQNEEEYQAIAVFTKMLGSKESAMRLVVKLSIYTKTSPWQFATVTGIAQRLIVAKFNVDEITPTLSACGDMAAALDTDDDGFARITLRMAALRVGENRDVYIHLSVLERMGVPAYDMIAEAIGKTKRIAENLALQNRLKPDTLFDLLTTWFTRRYAGMGEEVAKKRK